METARGRDAGVDILKCAAALLITNSHMGLLYGKYALLATGGGIGDALFFFCTGFTLFMGRMGGGFDNWYKRRINRIYPSVFALAIVGAFLFGQGQDMKTTLLHGGRWFVSCIMIYYVLLYPINRYLKEHLRWVFASVVVAVVAVYLLMDRPSGYNIQEGYFRWVWYFLFMLMGAGMGISQRKWDFVLKWDLLKLIASVVGFYVVFGVRNLNPILNDAQILAIIPLLLSAFYFYKVSHSALLTRLYENRVAGWCIKAIGGLCLEIYLIQFFLFTDRLNFLFPANIPVMFFAIFVSAYLLRCLARIFAQTFKEAPYDWRAVFKIV